MRGGLCVVVKCFSLLFRLKIMVGECVYLFWEMVRYGCNCVFCYFD